MATKLAPKKKTTIEDTIGISIHIIKENKDGSADAQVKFNKQGLETLIQWGIVAMLTAAVDEYRVRPEEGSKVNIGSARAVAKKATAVIKKATKK
jgi:hypothetical protein